MFGGSRGDSPDLDVGPTLTSRSPAWDEALLVVTLRGELDIADHAWLNELLSMTESTGLPLSVDLTGVTFADSAGIEPLVESTRRRRAEVLPALRIAALSPATRRIFALFGVGTDPEIDVDAWDALPWVGWPHRHGSSGRSALTGRW